MLAALFQARKIGYCCFHYYLQCNNPTACVSVADFVRFEFLDTSIHTLIHPGANAATCPLDVHTVFCHCRFVHCHPLARFALQMVFRAKPWLFQRIRFLLRERNGLKEKWWEKGKERRDCKNTIFHLELQVVSVECVSVLSIDPRVFQVLWSEICEYHVSFVLQVAFQVLVAKWLVEYPGTGIAISLVTLCLSFSCKSFSCLHWSISLCKRCLLSSCSASFFSRLNFRRCLHLCMLHLLRKGPFETLFWHIPFFFPIFSVSSWAVRRILDPAARRKPRKGR